MGKKSLKRILKKRRAMPKKPDHTVRGRNWSIFTKKTEDGRFIPVKCQYYGKPSVKVDRKRGYTHCEFCGKEIAGMYE